MSTKERISASVDAELVEAGRRAVASGAAENFSAWVTDALRRRVEHDRRMDALDDYIRAYEAEHGEITDEDIAAATGAARARAVVVRPRHGRADRRGVA